MLETKRNARSFNRMLSLLGGVSALAVSAVATPVYAQGESLDVIIVTTQKREENQQEVPISVGTMSDDRLQDVQAAGEDILALAARVPSLYAESSNGRIAPRFYIRGLGNVDFDVAASQPVSIVMDDVVLENVVLKSSPIFDVAQVEVSRGPQGTLFGKNTPAGVVKFTTAKPTNEFDAFAQFAYGSFNTITAQAAIGGPIIPDVLAVRASGLLQRRSDWVDNGFTGEENAMGGYRELAGRIQVLVTPSEAVSVLFNFHARTLDGTSALFRANILEQGTGDLVPGNYDRGTVFYDGGLNNPQSADTWGTSAKFDIDFGGVSLTSITAVEAGTDASLGDIDGGFVGMNSFFDPSIPPPPPFFPDTIRFPSETQDSVDDLVQFTQELRLASNPGGSFDWQVGFYFFDSELTVSTFGPGFPPLTTLRHDNQSWALFGQASYDLSDSFTVTGGVRYTDDERDFSAIILPPGVTVNPTSADDTDVSWDISGLLKVSDEFNLYARVARGFRGPTIQGRDVAFAAFSGAVDPQTVATSETILSYEAGFKSQLFDNRARFNLNGYYYAVDDQQFSIIGGSGNVNQVVNADKGVGYGLEAEAEFLLTENFFIAAGVSYNHTEIQDATLATATCGSGLCTGLDPRNAIIDPVTGLGQALIDGNPFPNAPLMTANVFAEWTIPLGERSDFFVNTDWALQGRTNFFLYESEEFQSNGNFEGGARAGFRFNDGRMEAAFFARNITNEHNVKGGIDFNNLTGFVNEPRVFGVQLSIRS